VLLPLARPASFVRAHRCHRSQTTVILQASEYFQDNAKLKEVYLALGTRLFEGDFESFDVEQPVDPSINNDSSHSFQRRIQV
jgi:hypothetical protein